jgi:8-oxo-dGTP pyrophosphatase MutT (NUDIX family)
MSDEEDAGREQGQEPGQEPGWRLKAGRTIYENPWIRLRTYDAVAPTGAPADYALVCFKRLAIGILPIEADGCVHLVGQTRFPFGTYSWEAPEGGSEPDEDPLETAKRELAEEAGLMASRYERILDLDMSNSVTDERGSCYLATGLSPAEGAQDAVELLRRRKIPFGAALAEVFAGQIRDALTVVMLLKAHHMAVTGALPADLAAAMLKE